MPSRKTITARKVPSEPIAIAAVMSFLRETRSLLSWTAKDVQKSLLLTAAQAREVIAALELQGYIKPSNDDPQQWLTTLNGEAVSGSKPPRFTRESVEKGLALLQERIEQVNKDSTSPYKVTDAVAFGDFLGGRAQAQAADVGIRLIARKQQSGDAEPQRDFLRKLRAKNLKVNLWPYEPWMSGRSHRSLLVTP